MTAGTIDRVQDLIQQSQVEEAERELASLGAEAVSPTHRKLCEAMILEKKLDWEKAAEIYQSILDEDPDESEAAFRLAGISDQRGDDELAIELYERCTEESPAHVNALLNLAILYEDAERYDDALQCLDRVLEEHPNHKRARLFEKDVEASLNMYYDEERERFREKRNAILETPVSDFELSVRSRNCLKQMNISRLGDLLRTTASELLAYKNFGETSLHEIQAMLSQKGLRLGQLLEEKEPDLRGALEPANADPAVANILNRSVAELELSVRSRKCLLRLGISTINELTQRTESELLGIKNFGMTSLAEIKRRLTEHGIALKSD